RPWLAQIAGAGYMAGAMPFYRQMTAGQMNVVILAALILTLGLLIRRRDFAAGAILGFAAAFKIAPIFLILVLAGMRRWRAAVASVIAFAAICAAAQIGTGWNALGAAIPTLRAMGYGSSTWASMRMDFYRDPFNQSYHSLLNHLLAPDDLNPASPRWTPWLHLGPWTATAATWIVSSVLLFGFMRVLLRYRRRPCFGTEWREGESALLLMAVMLMLLLPSIMWDHYMVQAMIVLMWLFGSRSLIHKPIDLGLAVGAFFLLAYPCMHLGERWSHGWGLLFMSVRLWGALILLHLLGRDWTGWMKERVG
ncbi:DUF2029 domain-containing protein, partial [Candidatus Sumerlaeota bacterium]|nr:DUF2029 domain-containing protein [Candidatus Sumerlaeota bacterium]